MRYRNCHKGSGATHDRQAHISTKSRHIYYVPGTGASGHASLRKQTTIIRGETGGNRNFITGRQTKVPQTKSNDFSPN